MQTFKKTERLSNYRLQSILFGKGNTFFEYPFRIHWMAFPAAQQQTLLLPNIKTAESAHFYSPAKCLVSVSKRQIKKAVQRNQIKRLVRESYRKNKSQLYAFLNNEKTVLLLACIYTAKTVKSYTEINAAMQKVISRLAAKRCLPDTSKKWPVLIFMQTWH